MNKPAAHALKRSASVLYCDTKPTMPNVTRKQQPMEYKGCRIYTDLKAKKFRVMKEPGNRYSEASQGMSWKVQPVKKAWAVALHMCTQASSTGKEGVAKKAK